MEVETISKTMETNSMFMKHVGFIQPWLTAVAISFTTGHLMDKSLLNND
jgi:hypothetical protein